MGDWLKDKEVRKLVDGYHGRHARPIDMGEIRENHDKIITGIRDKLKSEGIIEGIQFQGSSYTGVHIGPDLEFDVCFLMSGKGLDIRQCDRNREYAYLYANPEVFKYPRCLSKNPYGRSYVDPSKVRSFFYSKIATTAQEACDQKGIRYTVKQRDHGPATQIDVYEVTNTKAPLYSVDLVPAFAEDPSKASGKPRQYVAKPVKHGSDLPDAEILFRQSFSELERDILKNISMGNKCNKKIIRILKAMQSKGPHGAGLQKFTSYHIYTAVFKLDRQMQDPAKWSEDQLVSRLVDTMLYMKECMKARYMEHPFTPGVNLIEHWDHSSCDNNYYRLEKICSNQATFTKIMSQ